MLYKGLDDFNVIGDGLTDDTVAFQNMLDNCGSNNEIYIPIDHTILISNAIIRKPGTKIYGSGKIKKKDNSNNRLFTITANNITIDGLELDGNRANQTGSGVMLCEIWLESVGHSTINNCYIHDSASSGIQGWKSGNNTITNNRIENCYSNGIMFGQVGSDNNLIENNYIDGTQTQNGIFITASSDSSSTTNFIYNNKILNNVVKNIGDTCIESGIHSVDTLIEGNTCINSPNPAILTRDAQYIKILNNYIDQSKQTYANCDGIALYTQIGGITENNITVEGNTILGCARYGINCNDKSHNTISKNNISNCTRGIYACNDYITIDSNKIRNSSQSAITFNEFGSDKNCNHFYVSRNTIISAVYGINIYNKTMNFCSINNNVFKNISSVGVNLTNSTANDCKCYQNEGMTINKDICYTSYQGGCGVTIPLTQYTGVVMCTSGEYGMYNIRFGTEFAIFTFNPNNTITFIANSTNIVNGIANYSGWGIGLDGSNRVIIQRRGATITGNIPYLFNKTS